MIRRIDVSAISEVLERHGHDPTLAAQWAQTDRRAEMVELYCRVGVWHPDAAEATINVGLGVGDLAHHWAGRSDDSLARLDEAIRWYDSDEAAEDRYDQADLAAARACLEAVRARHATEATSGRSGVPLPWEVEDHRLSRFNQPRAWVAVALIETTDGVLEVWPDDDSYLDDPYDDEPGPGPCRLHEELRLDDFDAVGVLEDFLEEHAAVGRGIIHWEPTTIYIPDADGQVPAIIGLAFDLDAGAANWRYTPNPFRVDDE